MFFVDRVNVRTAWESSLWMVNEVTQLLANKNLKEIVGNNELVRSKLLEKLNSLFFYLEIVVLLRLTTEVLLTKEIFFAPLLL